MLKLGNGWLKRFLSDLLDDRDDDQVIADINLLLGLEGSESIADLVSQAEKAIQDQEEVCHGKITASSALIVDANNDYEAKVQEANLSRSAVTDAAEQLIEEQNEKLLSLKNVREAIARMSKKIN